MKQFLLLTCLFIFISCHKDNVVNENPYIQNFSFSFMINTSLPSYNNLKFPSNPLLITTAGAGIRGIIVMKVGTDDYRAYEATCPNQYASDCSLLTINGINAVCSCDKIEYSLYTGVGAGQFPLKAYRVEILGENLRVYN